MSGPTLHNYQQAGGQHSYADYYTAAYGYAIFDKSLCDNVTFADHSLATDSVYSETQLISCRNVLIFYNKKLPRIARSAFFTNPCIIGVFWHWAIRKPWISRLMAINLKHWSNQNGSIVNS